MSDTYKAVFTCPELNEREVWYVSSRRQAGIQFTHHRNRTNATARQYQTLEYTEKVTKVFTDEDTLTKWTHKKKE
tara:strand:- start:1015 stop:1239 length:225 start_codon:yes stop_codon:yes gene_type:complete